MLEHFIGTGVGIHIETIYGVPFIRGIPLNTSVAYGKSFSERMGIRKKLAGDWT